MPLGARRMRSTNGWPAVARPKRTTDMPLDARRTRSTNAWGAVKRAKRTTDMPLDALPLWASKDSPAFARPKRKTNMPLVMRRTWVSLGLARPKRKMEIPQGAHRNGHAHGCACHTGYKGLAYLGKAKGQKGHAPWRASNTSYQRPWPAQSAKRTCLWLRVARGLA